jgi:hypothetical protein
MSVSGQAGSPRPTPGRECIGFGPHEFNCTNPADTPAQLWCQRCEALRREHISEAFAVVIDAFESEPPHAS